MRSVQIPRSFSSEGQSLTRHTDQSEESIVHNVHPPILAHLTRQTGQVRVWQWSFLKVPMPGLNTVSTVAQEL